VTRAREAGGLAGAVVEWVCGDALQTPFPAGSFDLVSMQYPALPKAAGQAAVRALLGTVRPGGLLLAVYHDLSDEHREHLKSRGVDPADYVDADDLARLLGDEFTIELHAVQPRIDPPPDTPHIADVVLRAPGAAEARPGLVSAHGGVRLNGPLHYGLCISACRRARQTGSLYGPHTAPEESICAVRRSVPVNSLASQVCLFRTA
jgi:SAM-dependent methyltransferase